MNEAEKIAKMAILIITQQAEEIDQLRETVSAMTDKVFEVADIASDILS